jgi:hypothetical protein
MLRHLAVAALAAITAAGGAAAQETRTLGRGGLFNNDLIGDGRDRWRSGSYVASLVRGTDWAGWRPEQPFALREWRLRGEVVMPRRATAPDPADRRYAALLSLGMHTHLARGPVEIAAGAELVAVGPSTLVGGIHRAIHDIFGLPSPAPAQAQQIGDALYPTLLLEAGLPLQTGIGRLRPFVEAQAGIETFARIGADLIIGSFGQAELVARDSVTGQFYRITGSAAPGGYSLVFGADVAHVAESALLPAGGAATLAPTRVRLRAGIHWQGERTEIFYGITRLGREFTQQPVEQTVGSLHLRIRF